MHVFRPLRKGNKKRPGWIPAALLDGSSTRIRTWNLPVNSRPLYR